MIGTRYEGDDGPVRSSVSGCHFAHQRRATSSAVVFEAQYRKMIEAKDLIDDLDIRTSIARATFGFEQHSR